MTSKTLQDFPRDEQLAILKDICNKIYIARNISMSPDTIIENLEEIDRLFRDNENYN
jgi:hypothetical protein